MARGAMGLTATATHAGCCVTDGLREGSSTGKRLLSVAVKVSVRRWQRVQLNGETQIMHTVERHSEVSRRYTMLSCSTLSCDDHGHREPPSTRLGAYMASLNPILPLTDKPGLFKAESSHSKVRFLLLNGPQKRILPYVPAQNLIAFHLQNITFTFQ